MHAIWLGPMLLKHRLDVGLGDAHARQPRLQPAQLLLDLIRILRHQRGQLDDAR